MITHKPKAGSLLTGTEYEAEDAHRELVNTVSASGNAETLDVGDYSVHDVTLTADCTFTFSGATDDQADTMVVQLTQDGTGSRLATWPGSVAWVDGVAPTLRTEAGGVDTILFYTLDGGTTWRGFPTAGGYVAVKAYHDTTQAINNSVFSLNSEDFDTHGFHSTSNDTSRLTVPAGLGGLYHVTGHWYTGTNTERACSIRVNGSTLLRGSYSAAQFGGTTSADVVLVPTDYVELFTTENATFGSSSNSERMNSLSMYRVR